MPVYRVVEKATGQHVSGYASMQIVEGNWPFSEYDHVEYIEDAPVVEPTQRILTKLEYLRRFTQEERVAIRTVAKTNPVLEDYMALLELATEVDTSDTDTIAAVMMLEAAGLIGAGRGQEILNGQ